MFHGQIDRNTALGLRELRRRIARAGIPASKLDESINIATWNVREFGRKRRRKASLHFIAEILNQFDLIAVTEVRDNLADFKEVLGILGPYWRAVYSDYITDAAGNRERVAYVYDRRAVYFTGFAAEADEPRKKDRKSGEYKPLITWWRSPYIASFKAGSYEFVLLTAHIRWGKKDEDRIAPLELLAEWIEKRRREKYGLSRDIIVMGDFNIPNYNTRLYKAITSHGLRVPTAIRGLEHGSNLARDKRYDQILHYPVSEKCFTNHAGVLDFYTGGIARLYRNASLSKHQFTYQLSDHLPLWIQINTDTEDEDLEALISG
ncbi:MAG: endonuclease/exonuclease/phosphatase family protein [Pseudomonadota bacterium]|nr:MAG: endonuclease/exonuclease/phosphatase family protein [Pseudomonadota bacterium]